MKTKPQDAGASPAGAGLGTRERVVRAASRLFQRQGYEGTGIKLIAQEAEATLGSVYHFFPDGKEGLAVAAIQHGDREFAEMLSSGLAGSDDPAEAVENCARTLATALRESDWAEGCPVTATALETLGRSPSIQQACLEALRNWQAVLAAKFRAGGFDAEEAEELACTVLSALEGAEVTSQVFRSETPLLTTGRRMAQLIRSRS
ncbi:MULTISPECIES: TetR/AcrR family transcriptional regulator [Streptomyces]|jgi:AcrR family transcriptional regulator|uniref:TetR/AcrR family transcriptional regulator n=1 Tax=Streptomyces doudnae TaxID=3075536 RepID=A0ABD5EFE5_9ACTN|nr:MULTISPECIES: TetR/AcrR family transcriptional regulator [unclassified Streptomyces]MDT0433388.1 TetR/AcrR family transcriptional regulator [Streptomyces sp. DSM 41981]MYQ62080.1 TetR family transcriptional regulator [Streptomyces sp. SID4950]SCD30054.1 transcriptional regulator, TetR family [Streptomyces sp. SolWspMP-5a-2]